MSEENKSPFTEHLGELRDRLVRSFIAVGIGFACAYFFKERLFEILIAPLVAVMGESGNAKMIFTGLPEAFFTYLKVSFLAGIMVASPVLFYEFWMFISPGLYRTEKKYLVPIVFLSVFFFLLGSSFGYFIVFPYGFAFFLGFATDTIQAMPSMKEYLGFSSKMLLAFGLVFELPLVLTFMARMGLVTVDFLKKNRKYALLIFFVGAALITPPDVVTQIMMAVPLMILYEISIIGAKLFGKKAKDADSEDSEESEEESEGENEASPEDEDSKNTPPEEDVPDEDTQDEDTQDEDRPPKA